MIVKFSDWLLRLINHVDDIMPDLVYILPDNFISIPFEAFRVFKRESSLIVPNGMPLCPCNSKEAPSNDMVLLDKEKLSADQTNQVLQNQFFVNLI